MPVDYRYGCIPGVAALWQLGVATRASLLARLAVIPLSQEARGLDATPRFMDKLGSLGDAPSAALVDAIGKEEERHVALGLRWLAIVAHVTGAVPLPSASASASENATGTGTGTGPSSTATESTSAQDHGPATTLDLSALARGVAGDIRGAAPRSVAPGIGEKSAEAGAGRAFAAWADSLPAVPVGADSPYMRRLGEHWRELVRISRKSFRNTLISPKSIRI